MAVDGDSVTLIGKVFGPIFAGIGALVGVTRWTEAREEKREKDAEKLNARFDAKANSSDIGDIYNLFRQHEQDDRNRHDELLDTIHKNHIALIDRVGR